MRKTQLIHLCSSIALLAAFSVSTAYTAITKGNISIGLQVVATQFTSPLGVTNCGDSRLFVYDQTGRIYVIVNGVKQATPFLDISSKVVSLSAGYDERGLLGMAFHPKYRDAGNGKFYVYYSAPGAPATWDHHSQISEFTVSGNPNLADAGSERSVLAFNEPQANHNGGHLEFGPDGKLYISTGDGGNGGDSGTNHTPITGNAQDKSNLLGKVLRIDVDNQDEGLAYAVPDDNPFVNDANTRHEIWAYGLRNPYGYSFDRGGTRQLILGDVGQQLQEEVDIIIKGGNYGWRAKEGFLTYDANLTQTGYIDPIAAYNHSEGGQAVIGGPVYRGATLPFLLGKYIFGDLSADSGASGRLFWLDPPSSAIAPIFEFKIGPNDSPLTVYLKGFGEGSDGEVYACFSGNLGPSGISGTVHRIVALPGQVISTVATNTLTANTPDAASAAKTKQFIFSGKVQAVTQDTFELYDGSDSPLLVWVANHSIQAGNFITVRGLLDTSGARPILRSSSGLVFTW